MIFKGTPNNTLMTTEASIIIASRITIANDDNDDCTAAALHNYKFIYECKKTTSMIKRYNLAPLTFSVSQRCGHISPNNTSIYDAVEELQCQFRKQARRYKRSVLVVPVAYDLFVDRATKSDCLRQRFTLATQLISEWFTPSFHNGDDPDLYRSYSNMSGP